ncbi:glycosyltransferase family 39 protein [Lysinibacillus fusiformis]|nr:glycosyltransferase family 39 protein [Lysinibacillus fusiformis]
MTKYLHFNFYKKNPQKIIWIILFIGLGIRIATLVSYGFTLTIDSDDQGYIRSAKNLLETGKITYHLGETIPTVHIMPGQPLLLAAVFLIFGSGDIGICAAKILWSLMGTMCIYFVYLIGSYISNVYTGLLSAVFLAVFIPQVLTDNLLLTETPFFLSLLGMVYFSIRLANEHRTPHFYLLMTFYLMGLIFKANIALFPFVLLVYLILKKYPLKLAINQFVIAFSLLLIVLGPWWIRNYIHYDEFIPLTGGAGNPLLLGTYQGWGYLYGDDYQTVLEKVDAQNPANNFERMKLQEEVAKERVRSWWDEHRDTFFESYITMKTKAQWEEQFYWIEIFHFSTDFVNKVHLIIVYAALASLFIIPFLRDKWKEYIFLVGLIVYNTAVNDVFFAYDRYNQPFMFILFILISTAIVVITQKLFRSRVSYLR